MPMEILRRIRFFFFKDSDEGKHYEKPDEKPENVASGGGIVKGDKLQNHRYGVKPFYYLIFVSREQEQRNEKDNEHVNRQIRGIPQRCVHSGSSGKLGKGINRHYHAGDNPGIHKIFPEIFGGENRHGYYEKHQKMQMRNQALHPFKVAPEAPERARSKNIRDRNDNYEYPQREQDGIFLRPVFRIADGKNHPQSEDYFNKYPESEVFPGDVRKKYEEATIYAIKGTRKIPAMMVHLKILFVCMKIINT